MSIVELHRPPAGTVGACDQCAAGSDATCDELFHRLLGLDRTRTLPWGPLHAVVTACFGLQHPSRSGPDRLLWHWVMLGVYADGGVPALTRLAEDLRRLNGDTASGPLRIPRHYRQTVGSLPEADRPGAYAVTIHDVAVDGTFPAAGHAVRVRRWVEATIDAWRQAAA